MIGEESSCTYPVKIEVLDGPLRERILYIEVEGVVGYARFKKTIGMSLGVQSGRNDSVLVYKTRPEKGIVRNAWGQENPP